MILNLKKQNQHLIGQLKIADGRYRDVAEREIRMYEEMNSVDNKKGEDDGEDEEVYDHCNLGNIYKRKDTFLSKIIF